MGRRPCRRRSPDAKTTGRLVFGLSMQLYALLARVDAQGRPFRRPAPEDPEPAWGESEDAQHLGDQRVTNDVAVLQADDGDV